MEVHLIKYKTSLNKDELSFLKQKEAKDRRQLYNIARMLLMFCFVCPFAGAWVRALKGDELAFSYFYYFLGVAFLLVFSGSVLYWTYRQNLYKVQQDIKQATKTVESVTITRKQYMPSTDSYYFYLASATKLSIEVSEEDFRRLDKGDEVHIAYSFYSKEYLGYF